MRERTREKGNTQAEREGEMLKIRKVCTKEIERGKGKKKGRGEQMEILRKQKRVRIEANRERIRRVRKKGRERKGEKARERGVRYSEIVIENVKDVDNERGADE